jgi:ABC-type polysaccharide/polyol phosphate export permease
MKKPWVNGFTLRNANANPIHTWETIWMLAKTDLKMRYQGSWLGIIWVFLKPFCLFLVMNFVFSHLFFKSVPNYSIRLLLGIILWSFFAEASMVGMQSLMAKGHILRKVFLPKWIVVVSSTIHSAIAFFLNLIILFLFLFLYYRIFPGFVQVLLFGVYALLIYGLALLFSFMTATILVRFRDLNQIWEVLLQVLFYASPIIYPITSVPDNIRSVLYLNPMTLLIEYSRIALIDNSIARVDHLFIFLGIFLPLMLFSIWFFRKTSVNVVEKI